MDDLTTVCPTPGCVDWQRVRTTLIRRASGGGGLWCPRCRGWLLVSTKARTEGGATRLRFIWSGGPIP